MALTDISAQKQAENELRIAAIAFESSQEPMMVTDSAGVILRANSAFMTSTGYTAAEVVGKTPALLKSGRHDQPFYKKLWAALKEEGSWQGTIWNRAKNGKIYAEWLTLTAVQDEQGSISHYVATYSIIAKNREAEAEIHRLAYYDSLTQLPNRRLLYERIRQTVTLCHRSGCHGALLYMDLDNFKSLNDTSGHDAGDQLLVLVAQRLEACIRKDNTIARLSSDEFVIVLDELSPDRNEAMTQARALADNLRYRLSQPFDLKGPQFQCTASIGIVLFSGPEPEVKALLKQADMALYQAKNSGGNTVFFFNPSLQNVLNQRNATLHELKQALNNSELHLYFQIQVDHLYRMNSLEALIRWHHPTRDCWSRTPLFR